MLRFVKRLIDPKPEVYLVPPMMKKILEYAESDIGGVNVLYTPRGFGKTTALKQLHGLLDGKSTHKGTRDAIFKVLSLKPEDVTYNIKVPRNLRYLVVIDDADRIRSGLLEDLAQEAVFTKSYNVIVSTSDSQRAKEISSLNFGAKFYLIPTGNCLKWTRERLALLLDNENSNLTENPKIFNVFEEVGSPGFVKETIEKKWYLDMNKLKEEADTVIREYEEGKKIFRC